MTAEVGDVVQVLDGAFAGRRGSVTATSIVSGAVVVQLGHLRAAFGQAELELVSRDIRLIANRPAAKFAVLEGGRR